MEEGDDNLNLEAMDFKPPRKLNFNAPLLSTKRFGFSGVADTSYSSYSLGTIPNTSVPFSWEQAPGKPKTIERSNSICDGNIDTPRLRLPPCLWHPLEEAAKFDVQDGVLSFDQDDGCDGDDDDDNNDDEDDKNDDVFFADAMDVLSISETSDIIQQQSEAANDELRLKLEESNDGQSLTYMINRFLPDANALVASSSNDSKVCESCSHEGYLKCSTRHSYASSPKGCGLEFLFSWLMKDKICAMKRPVLQSSTNLHKHQHSSKHKKHHSLVHKACTNVKEDI